MNHRPVFLVAVEALLSRGWGEVGGPDHTIAVDIRNFSRRLFSWCFGEGIDFEVSCARR